MTRVVHFGKEQFENDRKDGKKKLRPFARPNLLESIKDPLINPLEQCIICTEEFTTDPVESTTNFMEEYINFVEESTTFVVEKCTTHITEECTINPTESYEYQRNAQICDTGDICNTNDDYNKFKTSIV
ncbi:uncharacterized protein [Mycetomoellerius zeteki]|uniref:uncharacterized protein isoform X2 n=1 Tax=Mycetomoellerius zeteki TaxID=64791 RepID=UPI00084E4BD5|nr:PREDICTED: uncharacterized protein LOC108727479 isoform X2 [Trachymyrmex zeteki]